MSTDVEQKCHHCRRPITGFCVGQLVGTNVHHFHKKCLGVWKAEQRTQYQRQALNLGER